MRIFVCDCCRKDIDQKPVGVPSSVYFKVTYAREHFGKAEKDLCQECFKKMMNYFYTLRKESGKWED